MIDLPFILSHFSIHGAVTEITPITVGLINATYEVHTDSGTRYVLQKINTSIFKDPKGLMENVEGVCSHLAKKVKDPTRETLTVVRAKDGKIYWEDEVLGFWRIYFYVEGAKTIQAAETPESLYHAAKAFGRFQKNLGDYNAATLHETIPHFHDTVSRYHDFMDAVRRDAAGRVSECKEEIEKIEELEPYAHMIVDGLADGSLPLRVTHNDTKLNNVMLDCQTGEGICVIDLDTVMPGSLLYDFGDGIRFAACNSAEDEPDLSKVYHRLDLFEQYTRGFLEGIEDGITKKELEMLPVSAVILTYELVLRFLGDYLNGDVYFKVDPKRPKHNLERARAQLKLTLDTISKLPEMKAITAKYAK